MAGQIDSFLQKLLYAAQKNSRKAAAGALGEDQTAYITFDDAGVGPVRFDREMRDFFNEDQLVQKFSSRAASAEITMGETELLSLQYALLAQLRRDFVMRRRTRLQARAHGIVRMLACGDARGVLTGPLLEKLKDLLKAGE